MPDPPEPYDSNSADNWPGRRFADKLDSEAQKLAKLHKEANAIDDVPKQARFYVDKVIPQMEATRLVADSIEPILGEKYKPFPSYADLLFRV